MNGIASVSEVLTESRMVILGKKHCPSVFKEISEYQPKAIPQRPYEFTAFEQKPGDYKLANRDKFYSQEFIKTYLEEKWMAERQNRDCFLRLYELLGTAEDPQERVAIIQKLSQFKRAIESYKPFPALYLDLSKYRFPDKNEAVVNELNNGWAE